MAENTENSYINRIPPHDNDAEQAVLSCMLFDNEGIRISVESLRGDDFYNPAHREIFNGILDLYNSGKPVDLVTVKNKLEEMGVFEKIGGMEYMIILANLASTSAKTKYYVKIVSDKSILRRLIKASGEISELSYGNGENIDEIINVAEKNIFEISQNIKSEDFSHIHTVLIDTIDKIEKAASSNNSITGIETGFIDFDRKTAGLQNSDLILIAARPSMGKTAFALNIAQHAAVSCNVPTAIFSLEMSAEQLVNRLLCAEAMVDAQKVRTGGLDQEDWGNIAHAIGVLSESPIYIDDTSGITPLELRAKCRKLKLEKGLGLIVIDYLQLMNSGSTRRNESVQHEIAEISKSLKAIAREMNVPVIALSQLSRAVESRQDKRPMLSDLRDSGAIEQDADVVCFLYRDEYYNKESEKKNQAEVIIAKQRNGPTGTVDLSWLGQYTKFGNLAPREYDTMGFEEY